MSNHFFHKPVEYSFAVERAGSVSNTPLPEKP